MKVFKPVVLMLAFLFLTTGCLYTHVLAPLDLNTDKTTMGQKTGRASSFSVLGLVAWGDASSATAAKNGSITTINHMDREFTNIFFGAFTETVTIVYGD